MEIELKRMENQSHTEDPKTLNIFKRARAPVTLTFEDVKHRISKKRRSFFCNNSTKSEDRLILSGASGTVLPGEMLVILGPSGSGKTTLLTALGGRLGGKTSGRIIYNGKPFSAAIKKNMGFVAQINYFYPHLTVHETLVFAALLRLPGNLAKEEKLLQVEAMINQLGLNQCKNTIVGGKFVRGISGGERKRLGIGEEMLRNPSLLFLDEPTSGLDSTIASRIVSLLWRQAKGGRTIVTTIHQPSSRLFYMFDKILLLSDGRTVYFGKGEHVMDYFASIGYAPSVVMNPSDFLLDLANGVFSGDSMEDVKSVKQALISAYESNLVDKLKVELQGIGNFSDITASEDEEIGLWSTSWQQQFLVLLKRSLKERRHQSYSRLKIGQVLAISFLTGLLWWQSTDLQNQVGLLFFYIKFGGFFSLTRNVFTFPRERLMLTKERSSGIYRLSSYFLARMVSDLPMDLALPTLFVFITYWMGGLKHNATNFFHTLIVLLYTVLVAQGLGLAIGAVVMKQKMAMTVAAVVILSLQLTGGFLVQNVPGFIEWIKYLSLTYYSYKLLLRSQYKPDERFQCGSNVSCLVKDFHRIKSVGLDEQVLSIVALAFMLVGFRLVAYVALMKVGVIHHRKY